MAHTHIGERLKPVLFPRSPREAPPPVSNRRQLIGAITHHFSYLASMKPLGNLGPIGEVTLLTLTSTPGQGGFLGEWLSGKGMVQR